MNDIKKHLILADTAKKSFGELLHSIGNSQIVLIGEASHGTHEFYRIRADITKRLVEEKGFNIITAEADWPDAIKINKYVNNKSKDTSALEALDGFKRFPSWM